MVKLVVSSFVPEPNRQNHPLSRVDFLAPDFDLSNVFCKLLISHHFRHEDLDLGVRCAKGLNMTDGDIEGFGDVQGHSRPIYYMNEETRRRRHFEWQGIVSQEESEYFAYSG